MPADPFDVLGIPRTATAVEVKRAYRQLAKRWHPDLFADRSPAEQAHAQAKFVEATQAHDAALAIVANGRAGGRPRQNAPHHPPPPPPPPPHPRVQARRLVEQLVSASLQTFASTWPDEHLPIANLANRVVDATMRAEPDLGRTGEQPRDPTELAALCLAAHAMEPDRRLSGDPLLAAFSGRIAIDAVRRLNGQHPLRFMAVLGLRLPELSRSSWSIGTPDFCLRCLGAPVATLNLRVVVGRGIWHSWEGCRIHRCTACARPMFREAQGRLLEVGWWGLASFILTPVVLIANALQLRGAKRASGPSRSPEFSPPISGPAVWRRGRGLLATFGAMVAATFIVLATFGASQGDGTQRSAAPSHAAAGAASTTSTPAPPATTTSTTTTIPAVDGTFLSKTLAGFRAAYGQPVMDDNNFGPVIKSAGAKAPTLEMLTPSSGPIDHFAMNFVNGTSEATAAAAVSRFLPTDISTSYRKEIYHYNNATGQLVGDCLAWNLHSPSLTGRYLALGRKERRFITMVFTSNTTKNVGAGVMSDLLTPKAVIAMMKNDATYRPENVSRVEVWVLKGRTQEKDYCYDGSDSSSDYSTYDPYLDGGP